MKKDANAAKIIKINEENETLHHRCRTNIIKIPLKFKMQLLTWCDETSKALEDRNLQIENTNECVLVETSNKTIMDYAVKHVKEMKLNPKIIPPTNCMRHCKKLRLPCELVGIRGRIKTNAFMDVESKSSLGQRISFYQVPKLSNKTKSAWNEFFRIDELARYQISE